MLQALVYEIASIKETSKLTDKGEYSVYFINQNNAEQINNRSREKCSRFTNTLDTP